MIHFKKCLFFLEKISLYLRKQSVPVVGDLLMLSCKVATKDVLGESESLLRSVFGKVILYLSCAICLCSILWKHGSEPTWETSRTCQATKWVTDERWNKSLSNTTRCLRDRAEAIRWAHMEALLSRGCFARAAIAGEEGDVLFIFEEKSIICLSAVWCKHAISCHHSTSWQGTVCGKWCQRRRSCFGESGILNVLTNLFLTLSIQDI